MKCYMADTGLLCALALANGATTAEELYRNVLLGNVAINEGMLVENFVAQTLASKGDKLFFYAQTSSKKGCERMEVDFLIVRPFADEGGKPRVVPIEVKSGNKYSTTSLDRFSQKFASKVGTEVVLHPGQLRKEFCPAVSCPPYLRSDAGLLRRCTQIQTTRPSRKTGRLSHWPRESPKSPSPR